MKNLIFSLLFITLLAPGLAEAKETSMPLSSLLDANRDCVDRASMKRVRRRLAKKGYRASSEGRDRPLLLTHVEQACYEIGQSGEEGFASAVPFEQMNAQHSSVALQKEQMMERIYQDFKICESEKKMKRLGRDHNVSLADVKNSCIIARRQALLAASGDGNPSAIVGVELVGKVLDYLNGGLRIERNPYLSELRKRFETAVRPGVDPISIAPSPGNCLEKKGNGFVGPIEH